MYDIALLKRMPDALSPERVARARELANASQGAFEALRADRVDPPGLYVGAISGDRRAGLVQDEHETLDWLGEEEGPEDLSGEERLAPWQEVGPIAREAWARTWSSLAHEWLDAALGFHSEAAPRAWRPEGHNLPDRFVESFPTTDGGALYVAAWQESEYRWPVPAWFSAAQFTVHPVAEVAGFVVPHRFDVT